VERILTAHFEPDSSEALAIQKAFLSDEPVWLAYPPLDIEWSKWKVLGVRVGYVLPRYDDRLELVAELKPCAEMSGDR
jgi:hypothetical protein